MQKEYDPHGWDTIYLDPVIRRGKNSHWFMKRGYIAGKHLEDDEKFGHLAGKFVGWVDNLTTGECVLKIEGDKRGTLMEVTPHKIIDNFLSEEEHQDIYKRLMHLTLPVHEMAQTVPMYFSESAAYSDDVDGGGYWHNTLYINPAPLNEHFEPICYPLLKEVPVGLLFVPESIGTIEHQK